MKVVINRCFGGYGLSYEAMMRYAELKGIELYAYKTEYGTGKREYTRYKGDGEAPFCIFYTTKEVDGSDEEVNKYYFKDEPDRHDPLLIQVVEELKEKASADMAELAIITIPDGTDYQIEEYDGSERIAEKHNTWS